MTILKLKTFFIDIYDEMSVKVTWMSYPELQETAFFVIKVIFIFAVLFSGMDAVCKYIATSIYNYL